MIAGILLAFYIHLSLQIILASGVVILLFFLFAYYRAGRSLFPDALFGFATFSLVLYIGFSSAYFSIPENQSGHYINQNLEPTDSLLVSGTITEELKPTPYSQRFILETEILFEKSQKRKIKGKILLNLPPDSLKASALKPGSRILAPWSPEIIKAPLNPFQFSYKEYLKHLQIERQMNLNSAQVLLIGHETSIKEQAWSFRERLISNLKRYDFEQNELAVFQALILGQRRDLNNEIYKNYAAAGAIHILAISGLHIGILLLILNFLFKPLDSLKIARFIKPALIILLLWSFAFLTGLSSSVVRAVCMFSFLAIGLQLKRKTSSLNSLFLSLFFLLLINPYYIFQVGFQLSYLAVFSIVIFQPMIYGLFSTKTRFLDYFWKLTTVSLAAQIGVIPLSLFYFHQFPGMFLVSNLILIPFLGLVLATGILVIILAYFNLLPVILAHLYEFLLNSMNYSIEWIAQIDSLVFTEIKMSHLQTLALYLIILTFILLSRKPDFKGLVKFLVAVILFQTSSLYGRWTIPENESVVFHASKNSVIVQKGTEHLIVYADKKIENKLISDYIRERNIEKIKTEKIPKIMKMDNKLILVLDSAMNYDLNNFQPDLVILRNSPKINLDRLLLKFSPQQLVVDGSNYRNYISRWRITAKNKKIPFHYTGEKGSYFINK
ncbi:ComEC family competence protein [Gramella lutea]|uniref:ComEC family competence protein n=1 Tax=Christiangramia lutea TaxID=1607951 RepID=A0A9X2ABR9_9FLAO|nr:ComEC/Rec2 family competence protein [Christiangramia lutea]MCH4824501.1 ComEC family competence protein [Christiangramia lutea]